MSATGEDARHPCNVPTKTVESNSSLCVSMSPEYAIFDADVRGKTDGVGLLTRVIFFFFFLVYVTGDDVRCSRVRTVKRRLLAYTTQQCVVGVSYGRNSHEHQRVGAVFGYFTR